MYFAATFKNCNANPGMGFQKTPQCTVERRSSERTFGMPECHAINDGASVPITSLKALPSLMMKVSSCWSETKDALKPLACSW